ncbi:MAG: DPP IV N-terminal domain-containing protein [Armatimonadota bacterium]
MLTRITLSPYDAQHLPIRSIKLIKNDTVVQFELTYPKDGLLRIGDGFKTVEEIAAKEEIKSDDMTDKSKAKQQGKTETKDDTTVKTDVKTEVKTDVKTDGKTEVKTDGTGTTQKTETQTDKKTDDKKTDDKEKQTEKKATTPPEAATAPRTLFFEYDLKTEQLTVVPEFKAPLKKMTWASVSPDEKTVVFARGHNLFMMDAASYALAQKKADNKEIKEVQLTKDGEEHFSFARNLDDDGKKEFQKQEKDRKDYRVPPVGIVWSKDSRKFALERDDERKVADLWVINSLSEPRPTLETYRYGMPGEANQPQAEMFVFDVVSRARVRLKAEKFKDQTVDIASDRVLSREREADKVVSKWLSDTSDKLYFTRASRDRHQVDVCVADTATGAVTTLIQERLNTYIDMKPIRLVNGGREIVFWSERDGWGHFYLYDANGKLKTQLTSGEYTCESISGIDTKNRVLYFTACGREKGEDPYFSHLYRVGLDGRDMKMVDAGSSDHAASMNDDARYFVDNSSTVNSAPRSELRDADGTLLASLETTDVSALLENGFKYPEPFRVKADDGITDLYGVMYKPFDFDPRKRYPVIEYVYPGPQTEAVSKTFSPRSANVALAQMGFIVIEVGNRGGSPQRSKWYHNFGYGNLRDYGLADKKRAIEELALKYPWIDTERVGITGHSGGGFMSAAAMLVYPDFFKVAFSESGNHENNIYNRWWSESHHGVKEVFDKDGGSTFSYNIEKNSDLAKNLKGHLMLVTGDIDNNVHPANTIRLANALIRANKRFDYFQFPGQRHGFGDMSEYCFWMRADYFGKYLIGDSQTSADILPLQNDLPQTGPARGRRPEAPEETSEDPDQID